MAKFRLRQHIVDAAQFDGSKGQADTIIGEAPNATEFDGRRLKFRTRDGVMAAEPGDWIVKGMDGSYQPLTPEIFAKLYEPA